MRISDWSSDVCSSDLVDERKESTDWTGGRAEHQPIAVPAEPETFITPTHTAPPDEDEPSATLRAVPVFGRNAGAPVDMCGWLWKRSEERRVGKACVSTCRSRWSPYPTKKKKKK